MPEGMWASLFWCKPCLDNVLAGLGKQVVSPSGIDHMFGLLRCAIATLWFIFVRGLLE